MLAYFVHDLNPYMLRFGESGFGIRWYGLSYLLGFVGAYLLIRYLAKKGGEPGGLGLRMPPDKVADFVLNACIFGVLIGGRLGYVLLYDLPGALAHGQTPLLWDLSDRLPYWGVLRVWQGGMAAHGGVIGVVLALIIFARRNKYSVINLGDAACMVVPVGLFCGRIANFINGELYGHPTTVAWGVKFPTELSAPTNNVVDPKLLGELADMEAGVGHFVATHAAAITDHEFTRLATGGGHEFQQYVAGYLGQIQEAGAGSAAARIREELAAYVAAHADQIDSHALVQEIQASHTPLWHQLHDQFAAILPARHPSQLYEAGLEGLALFLICWTVGRVWKKDGMASGAFLTFYPVMRIIGEQFRVGDAPPAWLAWTHLNMGVLYSVPMLAVGLAYWTYWIRKPARTLEVAVVGGGKAGAAAAMNQAAGGKSTGEVPRA